MRWSAFMYVLKHPTLFAIEVTAHERGTDRIATRNIWTFGMSKPSVARLQFTQQFLYLLLEFFVVAATKNLILPRGRECCPIRTVHAGVEMLARNKLAYTRVDFFSGLNIKAHWTPKGIGDPPSPIRMNAPQ